MFTCGHNFKEAFILLVSVNFPETFLSSVNVKWDIFKN
jgi:hypothetical protein